MAATIGIAELEVHYDSLLIVSQVNREYMAKNDRMATYLKIITTWKSKFSHCNFIQVSISKNCHTDSLAMLASSVNFQFRCEIPIEYIMKPSIHKSNEKVLCLDISLGWRDPITVYLKDGTLSRDKAETQKLQHLAIRYILLRDLLYKKSIPSYTLTYT